MKEIRKQKNTGESKIQGASVGRRRKSKRCIHFEKIEADIANYKVIFISSGLIGYCFFNSWTVINFYRNFAFV